MKQVDVVYIETVYIILEKSNSSVEEVLLEF